MDVQAGVLHGSILASLLFLFYINDLPNNLTSNPKLFANDTSLFSTVTDQNATANQINNDLHNINTWVYQQSSTWGHIYSAHSQFIFNKKAALETLTQNHLGMLLDFKSNIQKHFENMLNKANKAIGLLRKLQNTLPRSSLVIH